MLGRKYSSNIPLVEMAEQRIKVARMAVALAARLFSTEDGEKILVKKEHVEFIGNFLDTIYSKPSMSYDLYSEGIKKTVEFDPAQRKKILTEFATFGNWRELRSILLDYSYFRKSEFIDQVGFAPDEGKRFFRWAGVYRLLRATPAGYIKSPAFTAFLKQLEKDALPTIFDEPDDI